MRRRFAVWILLLVSVFAYAEPPLLWNQPASRQHCPTGDDAVWVHYPKGHACIRYFSAGDLQAAPLVVVVFRGDRVSQIKRPPATIPGNTAADQRRQARAILRQTGLPTLILARPGTYGSSGNHYRRRQAQEFQAINAALNAIKAHYGIQRFILTGQSGGATAASALLTTGRRDIDCAVLTSGAWGLLERAQRIHQKRGEGPVPARDTTGLPHPWDPLDHVDGIAADPFRLILVIGNPQDRNVPFDLQARFANTLREHGHRVRLLERPAAAPMYHRLLDNAGIHAIRLCPQRGHAQKQ
ncbi:alpha/beta hydrolase [Leclercia adecarboxylata]|uniref:alpha/beta hydrolase family protein n=1 Tax=Leclercia adecarboxylata TaxID=83655 RepID=UPI002DB6C1FE|nr:alpha/beta hydrolase [Leclercia adecarboxylata]MEB6378592.1 alpha/beta hydrolase [Leclercia adecarboxylata]